MRKVLVLSYMIALKNFIIGFTILLVIGGIVSVAYLTSLNDLAKLAQ